MKRINNHKDFFNEDIFVASTEKLKQLKKGEWYHVLPIPIEKGKQLKLQQVGASSKTLEIPFNDLKYAHKKQHIQFVEEM